MSNPKSVDPSLWWDPFTSLLTDLENVPPSSDLPPPIVKKIKDHHAWFVSTVSLFKPPNVQSREALNSQKVKLGSHELTINPKLKEKALQISSYLSLDELQSYIIVGRYFENNVLAVDSVEEYTEENLHMILLQYYIERQCLLKCTRQILMHALYLGISSKEENIIRDEAMKLISDGLEHKLISALEGLLASTHPEEMDADLFTLWAEETLIEDNLILNILFVTYYESLCTCNGETWKKLCSLYKGILHGSYNFGKLAVSNEALKYSYNAKVQLLLILMETLDFENLLQLVHDETPFRPGASIFSLTDIQEMDALVSSISEFETRESGPLLLTWAVFLCLISSLPAKEENIVDIDHVGYLHQAFESASLRYFIEILDSDLLNELDGSLAGCRSILRTFISAFIASYELNLQLEDSTLNLILDILCKIYRGEESLCCQFWDRESFIDGPIRCLLCNLEGEFPFRTAELIRLLSSLCEGSWPTECVYNFLDKSVGISSLFEVTNESLVDAVSQIVETHLPLHVPGLETLFIPRKTRGHVLRVVGGNTALVRWEFAQSGLLILILRLAQELYSEHNDEVFLTLDLINRMVSFNKAVTFSLMNLGNSFYIQEPDMNGQVERNLWVVEIICAVIKNLSPSSEGCAVMSMGVSILAKMLKCAPSQVAAVSVRTNVFEMTPKTSTFKVGHDRLSSESWFVSGKLAKMLLIDSEQNEYDNPLAISVLEFTMQLLETRLESDLVLALIVFSLQYILINHEYWKYKVKYVRWKVTLKVLEVMKNCIMSISYSEKFSMAIRDILLSDSSVHCAIFRLIGITKQTLENLYVNRLVEVPEIEGFQLAICSALDILYVMLSKFSAEVSHSLSVFHQAILSSSTKTIPVVAAVISLMSYSNNPAIQVGAAKVLSSLLIMAGYLQPMSSNVCFALDAKQIADLKHTVKITLSEEMDWNEDLFIAIINLLTSAARHQPPFLVAILAPKVHTEVQLGNVGGIKQPADENSNGPQKSQDSSLLDALMQYVERANQYINSNPRILLMVIDLLKTLWQGAVQYIDLLECLKRSKMFWKQLSYCITLCTSTNAALPENFTKLEAQSMACKYHCQSAVLEIMACEMFLKNKLLHDGILSNMTLQSKDTTQKEVQFEKSNTANDFDLKVILSSWCEMSILGNLIKSYTVCEYNNEICHCAKVASSLLIVHVMRRLESGDSGSLSVSLLEKIRVTLENLSCQPAFSELLAQYSQRGYSLGKELKSLILNDLYYHLQGELEGREIGSGPFKELSLYLVESKCLEIYQQKHYEESLSEVGNICMYDIIQIENELALCMWDYTEWKECKAIAETMLDWMQQVNSMVLLSSSKLSALKALITVLTVYDDNSLEKKTTTGKIPDELCVQYITNVCQSLHVTIESLAPVRDASKEILGFLPAQGELLFHLVRSAGGSLSSSVCSLIIKTSGSGLKMLNDLRSSSTTGIGKTKKILLMLLLFAVKSNKTPDRESEGLGELSNVCLGILPILCSCINTSEHRNLSLTAIDFILRSLLTPNSWFPIIQKDLQLQHVIVKLREDNSPASISITLKFLLTLAHVRGGAEMLLSSGFFPSLRVTFDNLLDGRPSTVISSSNGFFNLPAKDEMPQNIWGLGLAVITAMFHSLGESSYTNLMDNVIPYLFTERASLVSYYLDAPDFPSDNHDKKRLRAQRKQTSLNALKETEQTLMLMCTLAKQWNLWVKAMKEMDSQLREKSIHLLAFISRGIHRFGESPGKATPLLCPPTLKEEFEWCREPSILNSHNGWFALSAICCASKPKPSAVSATCTALVIKSQSTETTNAVAPTYFSDLVGLQIYRIAFLLLKYLCLEAKGAVKRSEELGFIDLAHFPELPMPEILHGLQDQAISIVSELCNANMRKPIDVEIREVCLLMLQIMEMALQLEHCVVQICGIRPVLGRMEDFSKEVKLLFKAMEGHIFLKTATKSVKQIISFVYPGLLETEGFL